MSDTGIRIIGGAVAVACLGVLVWIAWLERADNNRERRRLRAFARSIEDGR